jgi:hypothetical protein
MPDTQDRVAMLRAYINTAALLAAAKEDMDYYRKEAPEMAQEVTLADLMVEQLSEVVRALEDDAAVATFVKELDK